ncbi:hypothetical protein evm_008239 [Chilo suppressalis]|nr:hypothetical protein evm_008239 [Chilo suppressalis]
MINERLSASVYNRYQRSKNAGFAGRRPLVSWKWIVLWSLWAADLVHQFTPKVRVTGGWLRGTIAPLGTHIQYLGVPYASVPNRFQAPGPVKSWEGTLLAIDENIRCVQRFSMAIIGREDCLTINIYTPPTTSMELRPVMVFIHGGGFRDGSGSPFIYGPQYLVKRDVILVTFNYRVELLGYLCLGIKEAPGNVGLKDQVAALKWVKENIKAFGGDPDNVTIFGESAGSASVLYHLMSPMSKGLFRRGIMQSGTPLSSWSFQFEPLQTASLLAKSMGYDTMDPYEIYRIFINKTADELMSTRVPRNEGDVISSENIFVPCKENIISGEESFLTDTPYNILMNGMYKKMPLIIGHNNAEGYWFAGKENDTVIKKISFYGSTPRDLLFASDEEKVENAKKMRQLYMGNDEISKTTMPKFSFYEGDAAVVYPTVVTTHILSQTSDEPIYSYKFSYDGSMNFGKLLSGFVNEPGATHADELFYMFNVKIPVVIQELIESDIIKKVTTMWTNFAKYGDPTPQTTSLLPIKWRPIDKEDPQRLVIDKELKTAPLWDDERILYWDDIYAKYRRTV